MISAIITLAIFVAVLCFVIWLLSVVIGMIPAVPAQVKQIILAVIGFIGILLVLQRALALFGHALG
jgi:hypothetical protein